MGKDSSVAPKERINIKFVPATGDQQAEIELPLKMMVVGDFTGRADDSPVEERSAISVDKNTFASVMKEMKLERDIEVDNVLSDDEDATLQLNLKFDALKDFTPDELARKIPEVNKLVELREALTALKGPLGNMPDFRKALGEIVNDESKRDEISDEISKSVAE